MHSLSVAVITYNEERNIARCLASVKDIADEIVVVDSGSKDRTVDIATSMGARVIVHPFEGHIQQKNYALDCCTNDGVLSLDADEELSAELRDAVARIKREWSADGYMMNRLTNYCGSWIRHGGWYPDRKLRLFRRSRGRWTGTNPHDRFELTDARSAVPRIDGDILHYSYASISDHVRQIDYFTDITARELVRQGRTAGILRLLVAPPVRFIRDYVLKGGFMDGYHGFVIAVLSSAAVFVKYVKLRQLLREASNHG